jgi:hypothetical protein
MHGWYIYMTFIVQEKKEADDSITAVGIALLGNCNQQMALDHQNSLA